MSRACTMINMLENDEKVKHYVERTQLHIDLVKKYCNKIAAFDPQRFSDLIQRGLEHDASKLIEPERTPYIEISWQYKMKDSGQDYKPPQDIKNMMNKATLHHVTTNAHHPEFHAPEEQQLVNRDNRDKPPSKIVDATAMDSVSVAEMVADWCGMSEEKGTNPNDWAKNNINVRWKFSPEQVDLIHELLDAVWG